MLGHPQLSWEAGRIHNAPWWGHRGEGRASRILKKRQKRPGARAHYLPAMAPCVTSSRALCRMVGLIFRLHADPSNAMQKGVTCSIGSHTRLFLVVLCEGVHFDQG